MEKFIIFPLSLQNTMDPQLLFSNITDQFFVTLMVINLTDILLGEWRTVTDPGIN